MKNKILFLSSNELGYEVFKQCLESIDADFYVMTLSKESNVVMYDEIDNELWHNCCKNVIEIKSVGDKFDPSLHEALMHKNSKKPSGTILEEFETGYKFHDKIIRHAKVIVSRGKTNWEITTKY